MCAPKVEQTFGGVYQDRYRAFFIPECKIYRLSESGGICGRFRPFLESLYWTGDVFR